MPSSSRNRVPRLPLTSALKWSAGLSLLLTVLLITILSVRMAAGADPALGPKIARQPSQASQATPTPSPSPAVVVPVPVPSESSVPQTQVPVDPTPVAPVQTTTS